MDRFKALKGFPVKYKTTHLAAKLQVHDRVIVTVEPAIFTFIFN
jgi:hypothetical protein